MSSTGSLGKILRVFVALNIQTSSREKMGGPVVTWKRLSNSWPASKKIHMLNFKKAAFAACVEADKTAVDSNAVTILQACKREWGVTSDDAVYAAKVLRKNEVVRGRSISLLRVADALRSSFKVFTVTSILLL